MRKVRLLILSALTLFAFGALAAAAYGEAPKLLLLSGNVSELEGTFKGGASILESANGLQLKGTTIEGTLKGCKEESGSATDTSLCGPVLLTFTGVKKEKVNCHSEMLNEEEKDAAEIVLVWTDLHLAAEENAKKELQPLLMFKVLGALSGESPEEITLNCGGVKDKVKGVIGCLLTPGLKNVQTTEELTIACKIKEKGKPETGTCEQLCEWLKEFPFLANLGKGFEEAWMTIEAKGKLNKDVFIDD
jgi:hypothetical protein